MEDEDKTITNLNFLDPRIMKKNLERDAPKLREAVQAFTRLLQQNRKDLFPNINFRFEENYQIISYENTDCLAYTLAVMDTKTPIFRVSIILVPEGYLPDSTAKDHETVIVTYAKVLVTIARQKQLFTKKDSFVQPVRIEPSKMKPIRRFFSFFFPSLRIDTNKISKTEFDAVKKDMNKLEEEYQKKIKELKSNYEGNELEEEVRKLKSKYDSKISKLKETTGKKQVLTRDSFGSITTKKIEGKSMQAGYTGLISTLQESILKTFNIEPKNIILNDTTIFEPNDKIKKGREKLPLTMQDMVASAARRKVSNREIEHDPSFTIDKGTKAGKRD
ncbi:hypothetical protein J4216_05195 [Candidatus Woesearchaeota archaeon]|nr:hypothetical protein [Candidatus Woesearchaeota archaeon]